jgi:hypothetical protein
VTVLLSANPKAHRRQRGAVVEETHTTALCLTVQSQAGMSYLELTLLVTALSTSPFLGNGTGRTNNWAAVTLLDEITETDSIRGKRIQCLVQMNAIE